MSRSLKQWLEEGEALYQSSMAEYQDLERQLAELEARLMAKRHEVNQIASVIGKPTVQPPAAADANHSSQPAVEVLGLPDAHTPSPRNSAAIARALTGGGITGQLLRR